MARKRRVESGGEAPPRPEEDEERVDADLPLWMQEQSWSDWLRKVFASRLFILACFALDVFLGLQLAHDLGSAYSWIVLPVMAFFVALQATIYLYLWGGRGRLR